MNYKKYILGLIKQSVSAALNLVKSDNYINDEDGEGRSQELCKARSYLENAMKKIESLKDFLSAEKESTP